MTPRFSPSTLLISSFADPSPYYFGRIPFITRPLVEINRLMGALLSSE